MLLTDTLFPLFLVPSASASCAASVSPPESIPCCPLCSTGFHRLPHYYETVRLLPNHQVLSVCKTLIPFTGFSRSMADLPGMQILLRALATLYGPRRNLYNLAITVIHCCLRPRGRYRLPLFIAYGAESLHAFALRLLRSSAYA